MNAPHIPDSDNPVYPYTFFSWHNSDKGKEVWSLAGPGISREPQLSGSHNQFANHEQVQVICGWLNTAFHHGKLQIKEQLRDLLDPTT